VPTEPVYRIDGGRYVPTPLAAGPWFADSQHGGAVAALVVRAVEGLPSARPMQLVRLTLDLSRRVPMAPVELETEVLRDGLRLQSVAAAVRVGGETVARATALRMRAGDAVVPPDALAAPWPDDGPPPPPDDGEPWDLGTVGFNGSYDARTLGAPGLEASAWLRLRPPLVDDDPGGPLPLLAAAADFVTNPASHLGPDYVTANADLTIHVQRPPEGPWLHVRSRARFDGRGIGQSVGAVSDRRGLCALALKSVLVDRRRDPGPADRP